MTSVNVKEKNASSKQNQLEIILPRSVLSVFTVTPHHNPQSTIRKTNMGAKHQRKFHKEEIALYCSDCDYNKIYKHRGFCQKKVEDGRVYPYKETLRDTGRCPVKQVHGRVLTVIIKKVFENQIDRYNPDSKINIYAEVKDVCKTRKTFKLSCRKCKYEGELCNRIIKGEAASGKLGGEPSTASP